MKVPSGERVVGKSVHEAGNEQVVEVSGTCSVQGACGLDVEVACGVPNQSCQLMAGEPVEAAR